MNQPKRLEYRICFDLGIHYYHGRLDLARFVFQKLRVTLTHRTDLFLH